MAEAASCAVLIALPRSLNSGLAGALVAPAWSRINLTALRKRQQKIREVHAHTYRVARWYSKPFLSFEQ